MEIISFYILQYVGSIVIISFEIFFYTCYVYYIPVYIFILNGVNIHSPVIPVFYIYVRNLAMNTVYTPSDVIFSY